MQKINVHVLLLLFIYMHASPIVLYNQTLIFIAKELRAYVVNFKALYSSALVSLFRIWLLASYIANYVEQRNI